MSGALRAAGAAGRATPEALSAHLAEAATATEGLESWCAARGLGRPPVRIRRLGGVEPAPEAAEARALLGLAPSEPCRWRRVALMRGPLALSEAEIWFAPGRLPPAMVEALETGDAPFGAVVAPLGPRRETRLVRLADLAPGFVAEHRALIRDAFGRPLAATRERYRAALLG